MTPKQKTRHEQFIMFMKNNLFNNEQAANCLSHKGRKITPAQIGKIVSGAIIPGDNLWEEWRSRIESVSKNPELFNTIMHKIDEAIDATKKNEYDDAIKSLDDAINRLK